MTTEDFITELFCRVDDQMKDVPSHSQASLWPSEVVTIGLLHAIKGVGSRGFYRWLSNNYRTLFPGLPHRTRLFSRLRTPRGGPMPLWHLQLCWESSIRLRRMALR